MSSQSLVSTDDLASFRARLADKWGKRFIFEFELKIFMLIINMSRGVS
jgi:hypothetical protein